MNAPTRSSTRIPSVKRIFFLSSGTLKRLGTWGLAMKLAPLAHDRGAAGRLDGVPRRRAEGVRLDANRALDLPLGEHLHRPAVGIDDAQRGHPLHRELRLVL